MVAWGQVLLSIIDYYLQWKMEIKPSIGLSFLDLTKSFLKQGCISLLLGFVGFIIFSTNPLLFDTVIIQAVVYGVIACFVYFASIYIFMNSELINFLGLIKRIIRN